MCDTSYKLDIIETPFWFAKTTGLAIPWVKIGDIEWCQFGNFEYFLDHKTGKKRYKRIEYSVFDKGIKFGSVIW